MCGIAGVLTARGRRVEVAALRRMAARMSFRGPDGESVWVGDGAGLVHRRLSIIDLSPAADCPMANEDGSVVVVLNGEVYNFRQLRRELMGHGHVFRSQGDTETIVHGYEEWGLGIVDRLDGMFAFALWDAADESLHLVRDRLGEKPLYVGRFGGQTYFGSNPMVIAAGLDRVPAVDTAALDCFLSHSFIPATHTVFEGIRCLPPAAIESIRRDGCMSRRRFWQLPGGGPKTCAPRRISPGSIVEVEHTVEAAIVRAVESRLVADVPVGGLLSGGVDSSLVMAIAARSRPRIATCSVGFAETSFDERRYARAVARRIDSDHSEVVVGVNDVLARLPRLVYQYGQPFGDASAVPSALAFELAGSRCKVVLTGDGGDEAFGGYWRAMAARCAEVYRCTVPSALRYAASAILRPEGGGAQFRLLQRWRRMEQLTSDDSSYTNALSWFEHRKEGYGAALAVAALQHDPATCFTQPSGDDRSSASASLVRRAMQRDYETQLADEFLVKVDVASMGVGVESRAPFLAPDLVELAWMLPDCWKVGLLRGSKWLLKRIAVRYVPPEVIYRPKLGFAMPLADWFRGALGNLVDRLLSGSVAVREGWIKQEAVSRALATHRDGRESHETRLWLFTWLELWGRLVLDGTLQPSDDLSRF